MTTVVDSKHQQLSNDEIISIAAQDTGSQYTPEQVKASLVAETHEAGAIIMRQGNTLFVVHKNPNKPTEAFFRALNADTAPNYIQNSVMFIRAIHATGVETLITQFENPSLMTVVNAIKRNPPIPGMSEEVSNVDENTIQVIVHLGAPSKGGLR